ncbi:MAG: gliding motility-associated ABC transporter ATP-binding subunit GldA [Tenuifilum sp.]|uniref:gliding motility-associated ABC transporter ATP-binding subunit GldA n=1 Tax=Tenuifilum sp. TaxID=2760880 RepID=UPI001B4A7E7F|nr:gliding motility-associated ABC transporter ATP-binding subunit GldA [Bacteroidales bacterium]HOK60555.1 gliding motility-associated ABC transporter ATP-binding subunit GldA [Tenuifilum sp.]MBP9028224.1 gliding motility-associated ABC transporter ATP-binding subunit GldA [Bacteroidales bacterium]HOK85138.1 gliding motility-associated ABC transporter ATP-binding subunit GldA [Tenuifilum sp.]HON70714.1 gliding motility-associated ABC transporter ATP-binding subunit GldA [Tenuifilum sp.]
MSITVNSITKQFGKQVALNSVTFQVPQGQVVGLLGPNGAGKSTLMKIITGYLTPDSGSALVNGVDINSPAYDFRRDIGYLPEHNPLYTDMYVKEYLLWVAGIYRLGKNARKRVLEIIDITGIGHEQNKKIGSLSKGYRQRVGLAQALIHNPSVLILDEPTSGLDPNQIVEIRNLIAAVGQNKTVILSTHIMQEVEAICGRIIIINKGSIVADGPASEIKALTSSSVQNVVVEFLEAPSVELLQSIENVSNVNQLTATTFLVSSSSNTDIRPTIFNFAKNNNLTLLTLQQKVLNLEDVFQNLTLTEPNNR